MTPVERISAQCDTFDAALDAVERCFAAYREMVAGFRASGTLTPAGEIRAKIRSLLPDDATLATLDTLDTLAGVGSPPEVAEVPPYRVDLGNRWYVVTHNPAGWPEPHTPVDGHMGNAGQPLCPDPPVWKVERTGPRGGLWGHISYYCAGHLPAEYRGAS